MSVIKVKKPGPEDQVFQDQIKIDTVNIDCQPTPIPTLTGLLPASPVL